MPLDENEAGDFPIVRSDDALEAAKANVHSMGQKNSARSLADMLLELALGVSLPSDANMFVRYTCRSTTANWAII